MYNKFTENYKSPYLIPNAIQVIAPDPIAASFTSDVQTGIDPLTVTFTDTSTGSVSSWLWDFGDGTTSTDQNPVHEFTPAGDYEVTLTVTGPAGTDTSVPPMTIEVTGGGGSSTYETSVPGTYSFTADVETEYTLEVYAGGGGGGRNGEGSQGGGGGGGAYARSKLTLLVGDSLSITVGAGGTGGIDSAAESGQPNGSTQGGSTGITGTSGSVDGFILASAFGGGGGGGGDDGSAAPGAGGASDISDDFSEDGSAGDGSTGGRGGGPLGTDGGGTPAGGGDAGNPGQDGGNGKVIITWTPP